MHQLKSFLKCIHVDGCVLKALSRIFDSLVRIKVKVEQHPVISTNAQRTAVHSLSLSHPDDFIVQLRGVSRKFDFKITKC